MKKRFISFMGISSLLLMGKLFVNSTSKNDIPETPKLADQDSSGLLNLDADLKFAGQHVPLENPSIKQRLDKELKANRYWHPLAADLAQKASRYFAIIRPI